jgi:hypothetical protein
MTQASRMAETFRYFRARPGAGDCRLAC